MAWSAYQIAIAVLMVSTGSINTLVAKWADRLKSAGHDGKVHDFNHPFVQSLAMFIGEFSCILAFKLLYYYYKRRDYTDDQLPPSISGSRSFNPLIFLLPAACDMTATSTMYIGLGLTYASSFQMLRGAVIAFTGLLSMLVLRRRLKAYQWLGMFIVITGLLIVGGTDLLNNKESKDFKSVLIGDLLIVAAQVIVAVQFVVEEKFIVSRNVSPLQVVGWEGFFGTLMLSILIVPMYYIHAGSFSGNPRGVVEDAIDAYYQAINNWRVIASLSGTVLSIAFFNFAGISVTKELSSTTRSVLDSIRTIFIWLYSVAVGWQTYENFKIPLCQLGGFVVLLIGMFLYNNVVIRPFLISKGILRGDDNKREDEQAIINPEDPPNSRAPNET